MGRQRIWIPKISSPTTGSIIALPPTKIEGHYTVDLIDAKTNEIKQHLEFSNLITNAALDLIGNGTKLNTIYTTIAIGTGDTTPTVTDTALDNQVASTTFNGGIADVDTTSAAPNEYASRKRTRIFLEDEANDDLTELGWFQGSTLCNRSLFKDVTGNPTTVFKTSNDLLRISYEYRIYAPQGTISGSIDLGASSGSTDYIIKPQNVNATLGWGSLRTELGNFSNPTAKIHETAVTSSRTGNNDPDPSEDASSYTLSSYTNGTYYRDIEYQWTYSVGNFDDGVRLITWNPWWNNLQRE